MHAFLIVGNSLDVRKQKIEAFLKNWRVGPFDRIELVREEHSLGIADIRTLQSRITLKPYGSPVTAAIIHEAHLLTVEAQQALLKTLEEPPTTVRIILETPTPDALLPTILSRCQIVKTDQEEGKSSDLLFACFKTLEGIRQGTIGVRLAAADTIAINREEALTWIDQAIAGTRLVLLGHYIPTNINTPESVKISWTTKELVVLVKKLLKTRTELSANVNLKLTLDHLFLSV